MNDNFLYQLQEEPDTEFVINLHKKIGKNCSEPEKRRVENIYDLFKNRRLVQVTTLFVISLIALIVISPARALVSSFISDIGGHLFEVTGNYPDFPGDEEVIEPQLMSLDDALAIFPHEIQLPTYIPSGCTLEENNIRVYVGVDAGPFKNTIEFQWRSNDRLCFDLRVNDMNATEIVGPDSVEEISLDTDHIAALLHGGWDYDNKVWTNEFGILRLLWSVNNLEYEVSGVDREELIEIAFSTLN